MMRRFSCNIATQSPMRLSSYRVLTHRQRRHSSHQEKQKLPVDATDSKMHANSANLIFPAVGVAAGVCVLGAVVFNSYYQQKLEEEYKAEQTVCNYSGTHSCTPTHYFQPSSVQEVENLMRYCHKHDITVRPLGSGISPNGIAFSEHAVIDMSQCNRIIDIDPAKLQITVEAGARLQDVIAAISNDTHNMALENIPSIVTQQIGGLVSVSAHGTGIEIPPCDMQVVKMTLVTPSEGTLELTPDDELFYFARVGLGALGIITQVTLQCVQRHKLCEYMWVMSVDELIQKRNQLLTGYKHMKWLWIPYTNKVVVVGCNPFTGNAHSEALYHAQVHETDAVELESECQRPMRELLCRQTGQSLDDIPRDLSFADVRDLLLGYDARRVLDTDWIKQVNAAELQYWMNTSRKYEHIDHSGESKAPQQIDYSENVLSFKCGGQQFVYEICFPIDTPRKSDAGNEQEVPVEIRFVTELMQRIEESDIAAPVPLEHRFTAASSSYLSPAYSANAEDAFAWLGIILYIPTQDQQKRRWIKNEFRAYSAILNELGDKYGAVGHWAKVEIDGLTKHQREQLQKRLRVRFGESLDRFLEHRQRVDPKGLLINDVWWRAHPRGSMQSTKTASSAAASKIYRPFSPSKWYDCYRFRVEHGLSQTNKFYKSLNEQQMQQLHYWQNKCFMKMDLLLFHHDNHAIQLELSQRDENSDSIRFVSKHELPRALLLSTEHPIGYVNFKKYHDHLKQHNENLLSDVCSSSHELRDIMETAADVNDDITQNPYYQHVHPVQSYFSPKYDHIEGYEHPLWEMVDCIIEYLYRMSIYFHKHDLKLRLHDIDENDKLDDRIIHYLAIQTFIYRYMHTFTDPECPNPSAETSENPPHRLCEKYPYVLPVCFSDIFRVIHLNGYVNQSLYQRNIVGHGLYGVSAFYDHSCDPNVVYATMNGKLRFSLIKDIAAHEPLRTSYLAEFIDQIDDEQRKQRLRWLGFQCQCERCVPTKQSKAKEEKQRFLPTIWTELRYFHHVLSEGIEFRWKSRLLRWLSLNSKNRMVQWFMKRKVKTGICQPPYDVFHSLDVLGTDAAYGDVLCTAAMKYKEKKFWDRDTQDRQLKSADL